MLLRSPIAVLVPLGAPNKLPATEELLHCLEMLLRIPISSVIGPRSAKIWRLHTGLIDTPPPSPREAARRYAEHLSNLIEEIPGRLEDARKGAQLCIGERCYGGRPPTEGVDFRVHALPTDFFNRISLAYRQFQRLAAAVSRKQELLRFALALIETYVPGEVFPCRDQRLRYLTREDGPLVRKAHRDASGILWMIQGDDDAGLPDVHQF